MPNWVRCQIDSFALLVPNWSGAKLGPVPNWVRCQIGSGAKSSPNLLVSTFCCTFSFLSKCCDLLVPNCSVFATKIVKGVNLAPDPIWHQECKRSQFGTGVDLAPESIWHQECKGVNLAPVPIWHRSVVSCLGALTGPEEGKTF